MITKPTIFSAALLVAVTGTAQAQSPDFTWHGTLAAGKTIEIRGVLGAIEAVAASGNTIEVTAVKSVFADHARHLWMGSTKSMTGHLLGAAGGLEAVVCALALQRGVVPPTINLETPDSQCDLDLVPNTARNVKLKAVMSNSFGFGGHNVSLVLTALS